MNQSKRLKVNKRQRQSIVDPLYQKDLSIEEAFVVEKQKNLQLKERIDKLQTKCRLLYEKLYQDKIKPDDIFTELNEDIYQTDNRIKELEQQLYFRYSKQMFKLKKKVRNFFLVIGFQLDESDLQLISDEIDLLLLVMDVFQVKYDELMGQNLQTHQLIGRLRANEEISGIAERIKQLEGEVEFYQRQNTHLKQLARDYERQLSYFTKSLEDQKNLQLLKQTGESSQITRSLNKYKARINELQSQKTLKDLEIQKRNKRISELQQQIENVSKKCKMVEYEFDRFKKDDLRWKERYRVMEEQKNQRIKMMQQEINRRLGIGAGEDSTIGYLNGAG